MNIKKFKTPLIVLIIGAALVVIGSIFKIMHWGVGIFQANSLIMLGGIIEVVAALLVILTLLKSKK